jgi:hypothetical protein
VAFLLTMTWCKWARGKRNWVGDGRQVKCESTEAR